MQKTLFVVQVFLRLPDAAQLAMQLRSIVTNTGQTCGFEDKWAFYGQLTEALTPWSARFERGVWDYIEDSDRAESEYEQWCRGTMADASEAQESGPGASEIYRAPGGAQFMFVTIAVMLQKGSQSDTAICEACRMPDQAMWQRDTFRNLIRNLPLLNFVHVREDAVFVRPSTDAVGVSEEQLEGEEYEYLRRLS